MPRDDEVFQQKFPLWGVFFGVAAFIGFVFLANHFIGEFSNPQTPHFVTGGLLGLLVFLLFAYRFLANFLAFRITKDLYASREWFRNLYEYAQIPYVLLSKDGLVRLPNKAMLRLFGETEKDLYEKPFAELFTPENRADAGQYLEYFKVSHPVIDREMRIERANGDTRFVLLSIFALSSDATRDQPGLVALVDITARKEIEQAKTDFLSLAAHQLRTPLATMKWYLESLLGTNREPLSEKQERHMGKIYGKNQAIIELVNLLLNISRIDAGVLEIAPKEVSPRAVIDNTLDNLSLYIRNKELSIEKKYDDAETLRTDQKLLSIIVENLLSNAVKYTPDGGHIEISTKQEGGSIQIAVADSGYGIPKEVQEKVFTKLFRAENAERIDPDGTGLGLYLTKKIVVALGGTISFTSELDKGTTFFVTLPPLR